MEIRKSENWGKFSCSGNLKRKIEFLNFDVAQYKKHQTNRQKAAEFCYNYEVDACALATNNEEKEDFDDDFFRAKKMMGVGLCVKL